MEPLRANKSDETRVVATWKPGGVHAASEWEATGPMMGCLSASLSFQRLKITQLLHSFLFRFVLLALRPYTLLLACVLKTFTLITPAFRSELEGNKHHK